MAGQSWSMAQVTDLLTSTAEISNLMSVVVVLAGLLVVVVVAVVRWLVLVAAAAVDGPIRKEEPQEALPVPVSPIGQAAQANSGPGKS